RLWDAQTGQQLLTFDIGGGIGNGVNSLAFSPDGKRLATGCRDYTVKVWDAHTGQKQLILKGNPTGAVRGVAFSPDGKRIASGGDLTVWDALTGQKILILRGHTNAVMSVAFSPDGKRIASGSYDHTVKIWEPQTGR